MFTVAADGCCAQITAKGLQTLCANLVGCHETDKMKLRNMNKGF